MFIYTNLTGLSIFSFQIRKYFIMVGPKVWYFINISKSILEAFFAKIHFREWALKNLFSDMFRENVYLRESLLPLS